MSKQIIHVEPIGIQASINVQKEIVKQASIMLERADAIIKVKKFRYSFINKSTGNAGQSTNGYSAIDHDAPFTRPMVLIRLGQFLMQVKQETRKWINKNALPLVLLSERKTSYIVVGLSPTEEAVKMPKEDGTPVAYSLDHKYFIYLFIYLFIYFE